MPSNKLVGIAIATLMVLGLVLPVSRVDAFSSNQSAVIRIGEWRSPSYGTLDAWGGLAFDPSGNLWVADTSNNRVLGFAAPFSSNMSASFVIGQTDFKGTRPSNGASRLNFPMDVAFDHGGNLWVVDEQNNRLLEFQPPLLNGIGASVVIGQRNFSSRTSGNSPNVTRNELNFPGRIAFDASGNLWVPDGGNSRVLKFQPPFSVGMNASLVLGEPDFTDNYCNPSSIQYKTNCGSSRILNIPSQIAFDPPGDLWVAETPTDTGRILEFKPPFSNGMEASLVIGPVFPTALAFDSAGNLWLGCMWCGSTGGGRVLEYKPPFSDHSIVWENGIAKNSNLTLGEYNGKVDLPNVMIPAGIMFDSAGNLWVFDFRSYWMMNLVGRVLGFDASTFS